MKLKIIESAGLEKFEILNLHSKAFGQQEGRVIAKLVKDILADATAKPLFSLVAVENEKAVGHILFSKVKIINSAESVSAQILAPLAILPDHQNKGIGLKLINHGLTVLKNNGVDLVFVLGHPDYYPRCGFVPAGLRGFEAPYPIPDEHAGAWMVTELGSGVIERVKGKLKCCDALNQPEHWRE